MTLSRTALAGLLALGITVGPASAQDTTHIHAVRAGPAAHPDTAVQRFLAEARTAIARYHDRAAAIADGYRLVGPDFPGMGEHWLNAGLLIGGQLDAARPQILSYATLKGRVTLIGVAYALPLGPDESPPEWPGGREAWHAHSGSIVEESFGAVHGRQDDDRARGGGRATVALLHAWLGLDNPAGPFAADNWALPFARLGYPPPATSEPDAAKALSLLSGGDAYYTERVRTLFDRDADPSAAIDDAIQEARDSALRWTTEHPFDSELTESDLHELAAVWQTLLDRLAAAVPSPTLIEGL